MPPHCGWAAPAKAPPANASPGVHAAYFRDLDRNKFGVFYVAAA